MVSYTEPIFKPLSVYRIAPILCLYKIFVRIPTSLNYNLIKFLLVDSINGNLGSEIALTPKAHPELIR